MSLAATIRFDAVKSPAKAWTPSDRDRLVFQWVKFEGHTQSWVAEQLGVNQSSVSRMIERYEKWIAHSRPGAGGLSHDERLRAQRWLTYERNEWILTSALRIAKEMEGFTDVTKSTVCHPADKPGQKAEVRTENSVIDRSGVAARFLRLAFRVNMEQLKLVEQEPLPPLEELSADEWEAMVADDSPPPVVAVTVDDDDERTAIADDELPADSAMANSNPQPDTIQPLHKTEPQTAAQNSASDGAAGSCGEKVELVNSCSDAYSVVAISPDSSDSPLSEMSGAPVASAMPPS